MAGNSRRPSLKATLQLSKPEAQELAALSLILVLALWSCGPWVATQGIFISRSHNFSVDLPQAWKKLAYQLGSPEIVEDRLIMTREGLSLQRITVGRMPRDQELPHVKKPVGRNDSFQDTAQVILEDLRSNPNVQNQEAVEKSPAEIGGHPGMKLVYRYQTKDGLIIKGVQYGVPLSDWYYYLVYEAPARYYFERDLATFEKIKGSFKILAAR